MAALPMIAEEIVSEVLVVFEFMVVQKRALKEKVFDSLGSVTALQDGSIGKL
jgi:hypothetical protein